MNIYFKINRFMLKKLYLFFLLALMANLAVAGWLVDPSNSTNNSASNANTHSIHTTIDRTTAAYGERLKLKIKVNFDTNSSPNTDVLQKDFTIMGVQKSKQVQIINGKTDSFTEWTINVLPNKTGSLEIPRITVEDVYSDIIPILISDKPVSQQQNNKSSNPVFVNCELTNKNIFVQQETILIAQIYYRIQLLGEKHLTPPKIDNAIVQKLGDGRAFTKVIDGYTYQVDELRFAIYPQQSGEFTIPALTFEGAVAVASDPFGFGSFNTFFNQGEPFSIATAPLSLQVNEKIPNYPDAPWLPAKKFALSQKLNRTIENTPVGEPISRTIVVQSEGLTSSQIPNIDIEQIDGLNIYADQPINADHSLDTGVIGERKINITYIPVAPGNYQLPAINYTWFDLNDKQVKQTTIPAMSLNAIAHTANDLSKHRQKHASAKSTAQLDHSADDTDTITSNELDDANKTWKLLALVLAGLWILLLLGLLYKKLIYPRHNKIVTATSKLFTKTNKEAIAFDALVKAIELQSLTEVIQCLEKWARIFVVADKSIAASQIIAKLNSDIISKHYAELNLAIYGRKQFELNLSELLAECKKVRKPTNNKINDNEDIDDIYPA
jgi:hypothetical protein